LSINLKKWIPGPARYDIVDGVDTLWETIAVGGAPRGDYVQDERYIAWSTWMCGAIDQGLHEVYRIATGYADCSYIFK